MKEKLKPLLNLVVVVTTLIVSLFILYYASIAFHYLTD
jgi:hypothetical protein